MTSSALYLPDALLTSCVLYLQVLYPPILSPTDLFTTGSRRLPCSRRRLRRRYHKSLRRILHPVRIIGIPFGSISDLSPPSIGTLLKGIGVSN